MTDAENGSVASFGTLRRAHISRNKVSRTSFYLRVGALGEAYFLISKISNLASVLKMLPCFDMFHCLFDSRQNVIALSHAFSVFGLGTLIFIGLEIAMHATMETNCVDDIVIAHPILQALFTFLQMHFLFVNSQVIVERSATFHISVSIIHYTPNRFNEGPLSL